MVTLLCKTDTEFLDAMWKKLLNRDCTLRELLKASEGYEWDKGLSIPLTNFRPGSKENDVILIDSSERQGKPTQEERELFEQTWIQCANSNCSIRKLVDSTGIFDWGKQIVMPISVIRKAVQDGTIVLYDPAIEANPVYNGENTNIQRHQGPTYHPHLHKKGKLLADIKRKVLITAINNAHKLILKGYDMNAFVFDDPRRKAQYEFFENYINDNFSHRWGEYKPEFMIKILQIVFFLIKEDIYYVRIIEMLENMPRFGLNKTEQEYIRVFHKWRLPKSTS